MAPPVVNVHYTIKDGVEDGSYARFIEKLRGHLANHLDDVKYDVEGHPVLPEQRSPRGPARWIYVHLATEDNQRVTLAVRDDNVYLKGFRNKKRRWYEFGIGDKKTVRLLLRSTFLNCEFDYPSLLDGSTYNLKRVVDLRKKKVIEAVRRLSAYEQPPHAGADEATKRDLARLIVIVCESVRMKPHFDRVNNSWRNDPMFATMLTEQQVKYLLNWGNMSQALLEWKLSRDRDGYEYWPHDLTKEVDVSNAQQTLGVVQLLLKRPLWWRPRRHYRKASVGRVSLLWIIIKIIIERCRMAVTTQLEGRPLLEVFAVRANFRVGGAIAAFDGMRGQIIYMPDQAGTDQAEADASDAHDGYAAVGTVVQAVMRWLFVLLAAIRSWVFGRRTLDRRKRGHYGTTTSHAPTRDDGSHNGHDLVLTGPYRAISAHGSVSIEVEADISRTDQDISTTDNNESSDGGTLLWDCCTEENEYALGQRHSFRTRTVETSHGPLTVTYAVLSNAVEATVQVYLRLHGASPADILVHGSITASTIADSVLFRRDSEQKVAVARNYLVPLARSVVAVPSDTTLVIEANLRASRQAGAEEVELDEMFRFQPRSSSWQAKYVSIGPGLQGLLETSISWSLDF